MTRIAEVSSATWRRAWVPLTVVAVWWTVSSVYSSIYVPSLATIAHTLWSDWAGPMIWTDLLPSVGKVIAGFLIATVLGIVLGTMIGLSKWLSMALNPTINFMRSVPPPALLPVGLLLFGIGPSMNVFVIVMGALWPTLLNTIDGVRSLNLTARDMARSYRIPFMHRLVYVILPNAAPQIVSGMRVSLQLSIILIVVSEMVGATNGLGFYVINSQQTFAIAQTWAGTLVLGVVGFILSCAFGQFEKAVLRNRLGGTP